MRLRRLVFLFALLAAVFVPAASALDFNDESEEAPPGEVGRLYDFPLLSHGGCPPYHYVVESGALPPGTTLSNRTSNSGQVTGVPQEGGTFSAWIALKDVCGNSAELLFTFEIGPRRFFVTTNALPAAAVSSPYSAKLGASTVSADGLPTTQTWTVTAGSLPPGVTLAEDGTISGTPTATGTFTFTVTANAKGHFEGSWFATKQLTLQVVGPLAVTASRRIAEVGVPFRAQLAATGGQAPYTWSAAGALPDGLTLDANGVLGGVPTAAGAATVTVHVVDASGLARDVQVALDVRTRLTIASGRLPAGKVGRRYSARIAFTGGVGAFRWRVVSGALPRGLALNPRTGAIAGTPRAAGTARLRVRVRDALGAVSTRPLRLTVRR